MVDTVRSLADLEILLANNTNADVSPQDIRDLMVSLRNSFGRISQQANAAATVIADSANFFVINMSGTALHSLVNDFDMPVSGRLRYIGVPDRVCYVVAIVSVDVGANNVEIHFRLGKNGVSDPETEMEYKKGSANAVPDVTVTMAVELSTNDYVEMFVRNLDNIDNITIPYMAFDIRGGLI